MKVKELEEVVECLRKDIESHSGRIQELNGDRAWNEAKLRAAIEEVKRKQAVVNDDHRAVLYLLGALWVGMVIVMVIVMVVA